MLYWAKGVINCGSKRQEERNLKLKLFDCREKQNYYQHYYREIRSLNMKVLKMHTILINRFNIIIQQKLIQPTVLSDFLGDVYLPAHEMQTDALTDSSIWVICHSTFDIPLKLTRRHTEICGGDSCFQQAWDEVIGVISDQMVGDPVKSTVAVPKFPVNENEWELCTWVSLCALELSSL